MDYDFVTEDFTISLSTNFPPRRPIGQYSPNVPEEVLQKYLEQNYLQQKHLEQDYLEEVPVDEVVNTLN